MAYFLVVESHLVQVLCFVRQENVLVVCHEGYFEQRNNPNHDFHVSNNQIKKQLTETEPQRRLTSVCLSSLKEKHHYCCTFFVYY